MNRDLVLAWAIGAALVAGSFAGGLAREGPEAAAETRDVERNWRWHAFLVLASAFWPVTILFSVWVSVIGPPRKDST